ncbi:MAG: DUF3800 domain-containing protein [Chloroflexota bacterium]|nr:DUF3800 domain-containing protein [Chloroflexota bacterium]
MATGAGTRVLFVDDSGKPSPNHPSRALVVAGFSIPSAAVPALNRMIAGAKSRFYRQRGDPARWEMKSKRHISPDSWKRSKNRNFLDEVARILAKLECTVYSVGIDKRRMLHPMTLQTTMPLQFQVLLEHFAAECRWHGETGLLISDWSNHQDDAHASQSVGSFVTTRRLPLHPSVYYANSRSSHAIQVADLLAGIRRRSMEGDQNLRDLDQRLGSVRSISRRFGIRTHEGRLFETSIVLF